MKTQTKSQIKLEKAITGLIGKISSETKKDPNKVLLDAKTNAFWEFDDISKSTMQNYIDLHAIMTLDGLTIMNIIGDNNFSSTQEIFDVRDNYIYSSKINKVANNQDIIFTDKQKLIDKIEELIQIISEANGKEHDEIVKEAVGWEFEPSSVQQEYLNLSSVLTSDPLTVMGAVNDYTFSGKNIIDVQESYAGNLHD